MWSPPAGPIGSESVVRNRTYYDGDLAADLRGEALRVIATDGPSAVSLRSLTRALGVSHAAPRNHYRDKAALFGAIAVEGFAGLEDALACACGDPGDSALLGAGVAYVGYALSHPEHFAVMWQTDLYRDSPEVAARRGDCFETLVALVGIDDLHAARSAAQRAWALVHGLAALLLSGSLRPPPGTNAADYVREQLVAGSGMIHSKVSGAVRP